MPTPLPWRLRTTTLAAQPCPRLMGVVNVTPDSFWDGGKYFDTGAAVEHGLRLAEEGADLVDIGGQSTRPGAAPVAAEEELRRVLPVVAGLRRQTEVPLSVDTSSARIAAECLGAGAEIINDVTALTADGEMLALAARSGCGVCAMHMQGTPQTMQIDPRYDDVVEEVFSWLAARRDALVAAGIEPDRIALDPGIGFGKTVEHNLAILIDLSRYRALGCPLLVGLSRKGFIGDITGDPEADRLMGTLGAALAAARQGVEVLRVHDVAEVRQALMLFQAAGGFAKEKG